MTDSPSPQDSTLDIEATRSQELTVEALSLVDILHQSFLVFGRYALGLYPPLFAFPLIASLVTPNATPDMNQPVWWVFFGGLLLLLCVFQAGLSAMIYEAVKEWQMVRRQKPRTASGDPAPLELAPLPFMILRSFIPGVGQFGLPFIAGNILMTLLTAVPVGLAGWALWQSVGVPKVLNTLMGPEVQTMHDIERLVLGLTPSEHVQVDAWASLFLGSLLFIAVLNWLTQFWRAALVIREENPFKALLTSVKTVWRHPWESLLIMIGFGVAMLGVNLFGGLSAVTAFFSSFLIVVLILVGGIFTFFYLDERDVTRPFP